MVEYVDPNVFQHQLQQGQQPNSRGYPNDWQQPHWSGDDKYNPHITVAMNESDGTREYYDPTTSTHSYEHASGYHHAVTTDGVIENNPGKHVSFIGGGGSSETISGQHDVTKAGHSRENNQGDTYTNTKGVAHSFSQGGSISVSMGNSTEENYGHKKTRIMGPNGAWGVGVGPGDGDNHDNAMTMTNDRISIRANTKGDVMVTTKSGDVTINSGGSINMTAASNIVMKAGGNFQVDAGGKASIISSTTTIGKMTYVGQDGDFGASGQQILTLGGPSPTGYAKV